MPTTDAPTPDAARADDAPSIWSWSALLVVAGLWAFAVTQPLLSALGAEPGFFLVRRSSVAAIVVFAVALAVVPPVLLWSLGRLAELVDGRLARWYQRLVLVGVVAVAVAPLLADAGITTTPLDASLAVAAGAAFTLAYERVTAVALWARFTAILPVLSVGAFLVASPTSAILQPSVRELSSDADGGARPSVLFLVLDELPTASLLDADGGIDRARFPNLASLADDGTWYRNHTAAATTTAQAIPSILTGNGPRDGAPLAATYPDNLFTLLAPTHRLQVSESLTAMCPTRLCEAPDRSPAFVDQVGGLTADTGALLLDRIRPERSDQPELDDFAETLETLDADEVFSRLVSAPVRFTEFVEGLDASRSDATAEVDAAGLGAAVADADPAGSDVTGPDGAADLPTAEPIAAELDAATTDVEPDEPADVDRSTAADDRPSLSYLHLLLPHGPWRLYPDGQAYATTSYPVGAYDDSSDEPWIKALNQQRHLLQASYADHLVGEILDTLRRAGTYDDTLVVAMADHGVAFRHGSDARLWDDETASEIAYSPLIIKAPGQTVGGPDDANVTSLDVLPTVADLLGVRVPWSMAGAPTSSDEVRGRDDRKDIVDRGSWGGPAERHVHEFSLRETAPTAASRWIPPAAPTSAVPVDTGSAAAVQRADIAATAGPELLDGLLSPLGAGPWLGRPLDEVVGPADPATAPSATLVPPAPAAEPEGLVRGTVADPPPGALVLVAVGGRVVTAAPLISLDDVPGTFLALLPPDALVGAVDRSTVALALVTGAGTEDVALARLVLTT